MNLLRISALLCLTACPKPGDGVDPKLIADGHYLQGQSAFMKGEFAEAHKQFAEVKLDDAIAAFETAAKADGKRGATWSRLGYLYLLKRDKEKARAALDTALTLNPKDPSAHESLADLHFESGEREAGLASLQRAFELAPELTRAELAMRLAEELPKSGRDEAVLPLLEAAVGSGAKSAPLFSELGERLVAAGRLADAATAYTSAAKYDEKDPAWWELVGHLEVRLGHPVEAERAFRASLQVQERGVVHVALARLCQEKQDDACVAKELERALVTATGEEMRETIDLAELLYSTGRKKDALHLYRELSEEQEQQGDLRLHLRTARLAKELKDETTVKAACARALAGGPSGLRCP